MATRIKNRLAAGGRHLDDVEAGEDALGAGAQRKASAASRRCASTST